MSKRTYDMDFNGIPLSLETGELAQFANGSVLVRYGDTVVLTTVTASQEEREGIDFFPLSVDYEEKMYSVGKIPGGFLRREGRPTENAMLTARSIDRPIRPLFPSDLRRDVVVNNLVLSVDHDCSPQVAALIGTSAAITISDIPWNGPVAGVQVGIVDGEIIVNPTIEERDDSELDLFLAGTDSKICMIEAGADEVPEETMLEAIEKGHRVIQNVCHMINQMRDEIGKPKFDYTPLDVPDDVFARCRELFLPRIREAVLSDNKTVREQNVADLKLEIAAMLEEENSSYKEYAGDVTYKLEKIAVRDHLLKEHRRVDGRSLDEIRQINTDIDLLPCVHGSALFQRGQTQVLTICTLGTTGNAQRLDGIEPQETKRFMHQYNFPSYSVGEARPNRSPGRREIGHGALAERSFHAVLPDVEEFPYAIRCVSEVLMSNGSTSQASVCATSMALMAAGVPITKPVAGISSGLIIDEENPDDYLVFMDIQGIEDFYGDMDFKVAGTCDGITSIQVDIKVDGLTMDIIRDAFDLTRRGRLEIINEHMNRTIAEAREELSPYAPKIDQIDIPSDKIRDIIGSGGKVIRRITDETNTEIEVEEDGEVGHVYIASLDQASGKKAMDIIRAIAFDPEPGTVFDGVVTRLMSFGAFVEIAPGKEGLVHISKMAWSHVNQVEDVVSVGDNVTVVVSEIDEQGRLNLSMRDAIEKPDDYVESKHEGRRGNESDRDRGGRRGGRGSRDRDGKGGSRYGRSFRSNDRDDDDGYGVSRNRRERRPGGNREYGSDRSARQRRGQRGSEGRDRRDRSEPRSERNF